MITLGSDVEYFVADKSTDEIVSAEGHIPGSKHEPHKFMPGNDFFATQLDNVTAEGNIPPTDSIEEFVVHMGTLRAYIDSLLEPKNLKTVAIPAARLHERFLQTKNARTFGCDPSYDCWTNQVVAPKPTGDNLRSAGFHIHVGYQRPSLKTNIQISRAMDLFLGIPAVLLEPENERKAVGYGKAGNYRDQRHGVEYRVLSSHFASSNILIRWCLKNTVVAVELALGGSAMPDNMADAIVDTINHNNKMMARNLVREFSIPLPW